jgi:hypothetical protein
MDDASAILASAGSLPAPDVGGYPSIAAAPTTADDNNSTGATSTDGSSAGLSAATIGFSADRSGKTKLADRAAAASTNKQLG